MSIGNRKEVDTLPYMANTWVGVDPGKNGGIAIIKGNSMGDESVKVYRCPDNVLDLGYILTSNGLGVMRKEELHVLIEHVHAFPGQGVVSTFSFGRNLGWWEGAFGSLDLEHDFVAPKKWMSYYSTTPGMSKRERKRFLRGIAERLFPNVKMTFNISDALLIANYCKEIYLKEALKEWRRGEKS